MNPSPDWRTLMTFKKFSKLLCLLLTGLLLVSLALVPVLGAAAGEPAATGESGLSASFQSLAASGSPSTAQCNGGSGGGCGGG
jgi:hypothetical protein